MVPKQFCAIFEGKVTCLCHRKTTKSQFWSRGDVQHEFGHLGRGHVAHTFKGDGSIDLRVNRSTVQRYPSLVTAFTE
jgi:hypothetical protein